ncbi:hypothetical protein WJX74_004581 [Apatococcus lobatus]|uniref:ENT domain-containing protein n=1 Tax=Apatococcus lobatus TaxID=904363 RepID=A0AAW1RDG7_9CHLO
MGNPTDWKQQGLRAHGAVLRYMVTQPISWEIHQFLDDLQKQLNITPEEHGDMLRSAREAHALEVRGETPLPGPRLSYRASTSLPPTHMAPARQPGAGHGGSGPGVSEKRKSSMAFAAPPSPQAAPARLAPRPDAAAVARHGLHEDVGKKVWRYWANEEPPWVEGTVTDYNPTTDEHGIIYYLGTRKEEWESFVFAKGKPGKDYKWSENPPLDPMTLFPAGALDGVHIRRIPSNAGTSTSKRGRGRGRPSLSHRANGIEQMPSHSVVAASRQRFVPLQAPNELNQLLETGSLLELQELQDAFLARMAAVKAHLDILKPLHDDPGLNELESCQLHLKAINFLESQIQEELSWLTSSDDDF